MPKEYYAKSDGVTTVKKHLNAVSGLAAMYGQEINLESSARMTGMFHDVAKYSDAFQKVLRRERTGADHALPGALVIYALSNRQAVHECEAIAAHHGRLEAMPYLEPAMRNVAARKHATCPSGRESVLSGPDEVKTALTRFKIDFPNFALPDITDLKTPKTWDEKLRYMLDARMLLSCQVDADYTVSGLEPDPPAADEIYAQERAVRPERALMDLETYRSGVIRDSTSDKTLNALRQQVYDACAAAGRQDSDFMTLTAPTGSGKTLAMLRFAIEKIRRDPSKRRVIMALPFLTVSDQAEQVVRHMFPDAMTDNSMTDYTDDQRELTGTWNADCVVTTTVQLFKSLFSDRPADVRKLHRIANSVLILDEVQALPVHLSDVLIRTLRILSDKYNVCVLLSTATQPAYGHIDALDFRPVEIVPDAKAAFGMNQRTGIAFDRDTRDLRVISEKAASGENTCVMTNLKAQARTVYGHWKSLGIRDAYLISTDLCGRHRQDVIREIKARQAKGLPVHVAATQCLEAGVDLDFRKIFRALAPLTSLIQSAGRQNRNNRYPQDSMTVFEPWPEPGSGTLYPGTDYERQATVVKLMLSNGADLNGLDAIDEYYERIFRDFERPKKLTESLDALDFRTFADQTRLIRNSACQVVVPYDMDAYKEILGMAMSGQVTRKTLAMSAGLTVQSWDRHAVESHCQELVMKNHRTGRETRTGMYVLLPGHEPCYDMETGLSFDDTENLFVI